MALDVHPFERAANDAAGLGWRALRIGFGRFCMTHSFVVAGKMLSATRERQKTETVSEARKKLQREGLLPIKPRVAPGVAGRGGPARALPASDLAPTVTDALDNKR